MNNVAASQDPERSEPEEVPFEIADYRWEKEIERDLMLLLQTWHADGSVEEDLEHPEATAGELLKLHSRYFQEPVYFPLAADTEQALGDALTKAAGLILVECKQCIEPSAWRREALPAWKTPDPSDPTKEITSNKGGKNRWAQLGAVSLELDNELPFDLKLLKQALDTDFERPSRRIADECHVLVGAAPKHPGPGPAALRFTPYWSFMVDAGNPGAILGLEEMSLLKEKGSRFGDFRSYVLALIAARRSSGTDSRRLEDQLIVLAFRGRTWSGYRATDSMLEKALNAALEKRNKASLRRH